MPPPWLSTKKLVRRAGDQPLNAVCDQAQRPAQGWSVSGAKNTTYAVTIALV